MTSNCGRIQALVMRIQNDYLDNPALRLTVPRAQVRFGVDALTGEAVLDALVDASVLARTPDGAYVRFFPRSAPVTAPRRTSAPPAGARLEALASGTRGLRRPTSSCRWPWCWNAPRNSNTSLVVVRGRAHSIAAGNSSMATAKISAFRARTGLTS